MADIFSSESLAKQVGKIADLPTNEGHVGVVAQGNEVGVEGSVKADIGKGVFVGADGSWFTRTGYRAAAWLGWKKK